MINIPRLVPNITIFENPHYQQIGGAAGVAALVERLYAPMDSLPETQTIRKLHGDDLSNAKEKLFMFLSGWLGGPPLFCRKLCHPQLRKRHASFSIGIQERDQWMLCMRQAMADSGLNKDLCMQLDKAFYKIADAMRNQPE